jgi:TRAP-type C4-dicarboxylate transport system substrate-binding protein
VSRIHLDVLGGPGGQMNPIPIIAFAKFDEVQEYLSITNHVITPYIWFMNGEFYNNLKPEHRKIVDWAGAAQPAVRALIEEKYGAEGKQMLDAMLVEIEEAKK